MGPLGRVTVWIMALALSAVAFVLWLERGPEPPFLGRTLERVPPRAETLGPGLHLAGSGGCLVITRHLAAAYRLASPEARIVVHESIGSTGGVRVVADDVLPIGLISRPLNEREQRLGLTALPYARVPIVLLAHPDVRDEGWSEAELTAAVQGTLRSWRDGTPLVWLQRERGDSGTAAIARAVSTYGALNDEALEAHRFRVVYHDDELVRAVLSVRGGVGISDLAQAHAAAPTARVLRYGDVEPTAENVRNRTYPFARDIAFVVHEPLRADVAAFLDFVWSDAGRTAIESMGAVALSPSGEARSGEARSGEGGAP